MPSSSPSASHSDSNEASSGPINMKIGVGTDAPSPSDDDAAPLPFRLVLVSNLTPETTPVDWSDGHYRHQLSDKSVADLMAELTPHLSIEVPNTLSSDPDAWTVDLSFPTLSAFEPQQLARQLDATDQLLDLRDLLRAAADEEIGAEAFDRRLSELGFDVDWAEDLYRLLTGEARPEDGASSSPPPSEPESGALDRVFDIVDTDEAAPAGPDAGHEQDATNGVPPDIGDGPDGPLGTALETGRRADGDAAEHIIGRLTEAFQAQVEALLHHPAVRELEAAWRGLAFLHDRTDLDAPVDLTVLPAPPDALHEAVHHQVLVPEHNDADEEPPVSMILVDHAFGREHVDIEQLADLAATGQSLQTPVVAAVGPDFFGMESLQGLEQLPSLRPHLQGTEYLEWERLRDEDATAFLGLALPPFRLRAAYTPGDHPVGIREDRPLYGGGALAVGVAAARSFADTGWPTHLTDYPVTPPSTAPSNAPLAASLSGSMQSELARAGFVVAETQDTPPGLQLAYASSVREPGSYTDPAAAAEARKRLTLPCQLFAGRAAHRVLDLKQSLDWSQSLAAVCEDVAAAMAAFLQVPRDEAEIERADDAASGDADESDAPFPPVLVEEVDEADLAEQDVLAVRLRPPEHVLDPNARLAMALRPPRATA